MTAIFTTFGIDWHLLLISAINFGLLLLGLWYFLYTPMMRMLEHRRQVVAQGVADAQAAHRELSEIEKSRAQTLARAGKEADDIVAHARHAGQTKGKELVMQAEAASTRLLSEAEIQAKELKDRAIEESKHEVAKLIVLGMEKAMTRTTS